jgi:hypothetical protein
MLFSMYPNLVGDVMSPINLTPHAIVLLKEDSEGTLEGVVGNKGADMSRFRVVDEIPSSGVARATTAIRVVGRVEVNGEMFPVTKTTFGAPEGLPEPDRETTYIVSLITAQAAATAGRPTHDLMVVSGTIRDAAGRTIGCTGFGRV